MSDSEAVVRGPSEAVTDEDRQPRATCPCQAAMCSAMQRICPCAELKEGTARLRGSIRARPLTAVLIAVGVGVLAGWLTGSRDRMAGARR
jgi:hypothetical protein